MTRLKRKASKKVSAAAAIVKKKLSPKAETTVLPVDDLPTVEELATAEEPIAIEVEAPPSEDSLHKETSPEKEEQSLKRERPRKRGSRGGRRHNKKAKEETEKSANPQNAPEEPTAEIQPAKKREEQAKKVKRAPQRMIINAMDPQETRIALAEGDSLINLFWDKESEGLHRGDIVLGRINHIEKGLQAAFVDLGDGQTGFLHEKNVVLNNHVNPSFLKGTIKGDIPQLNQFILVQLLKDKYSSKCPTITMEVSIPGRNLVMLPVAMEDKIGISRKISEDAERKRLKQTLRDMELPKDVSFIVRTAGAGATEDDLKRDIAYLQRLQDLLVQKVAKARTPGIIYQESDFVIRTIRDIVSDDIVEILIDDEQTYKHLREFMKNTMPECLKRLKRYRGNSHIFHHFKVEKQIQHVLQREVPLPSGGSIVIEPTEAMTTIDVNSGKSHHGKNTEETALHTDLEAVDEIARQMRMRDLGGIIAVDFIDMQSSANRKRVYSKMIERLKEDKARTRALEMSKFCVMEITRQRVGHSLTKYVHETCPMCNGRGLVKGTQSLFPQLLRDLKAICLNQKKPNRIEIILAEGRALEFANAKRAALIDLETRTKHHIDVTSDPKKKLDEFEIKQYSL
jgi:ribonuclease E